MPAITDLAPGQHLRVLQTIYASGVPVLKGWIVRVDSVREHVEERVYDLTVSITPIDPPGGTILWQRSNPLYSDYLNETFELV